MEAKVLRNELNIDEKRYLRLATTGETKYNLSYLYLGANDMIIGFLAENFQSGLVANSFEGAKKLIHSERLIQNKVDVIFIDIMHNNSALKEFCQFLSQDNIYAVIPVVYNIEHIKDPAQVAEVSRIVDDVIDLSNWKYNFHTKISFLKKVKEKNAQKINKKQEALEKNHYLKRMLDILVASVLILLLSPVFLLIALAIRLESRGPIFYNAKRAGRGFRIFKFYKFRTMEVNADKKIAALAHLNQYSADGKGPQFFKLANDPRITTVGKFLRNTSLDELPQLFNVLKGDMSLVGNRPLPLYEAATLTTNEFVERFMAPAGITGLWQIEKRGKSDMSVEERISLDIAYARKYNLLYDFRIMMRTPKALIQKSNV